MEFNKTWLQYSQTNVSRSVKNTLRGLHYQSQYPQRKEVTVLQGEIFDAWVNINRYSADYGKNGTCILSEDCGNKLIIPADYAHGFLVLSDYATVLYHVNEPRKPEYEQSIRWDSCGIDWPLQGDPILSERDANAPSL